MVKKRSRVYAKGYLYGKRKSRLAQLLPFAAAVVALLLIAAGAYFLFFNK